MKPHKIKVKVPVEKRSLFGIKKTVYEERVIKVDDKTYRELKKKKSKPYSIDEMMLYDEIFDEWDD